VAQTNYSRYNCRRKLLARVTAREKIEETEDHFALSIRTLGETLQLQSELKELQYYCMQQCPGTMLGRRVDVVKDMWSMLRE
jgi:hypothetical protein